MVSENSGETTNIIGLPEKYRTPDLTLHRAQEYRAICELISRSPLQLRQLWTLEPCFIPTAFQKHKVHNFSKAVDLAKQAILADWKNIDLGTYEREISRKVLKRPASNGIGDRRPRGIGPKGRKRRGSQLYDLSDDENITSLSVAESDVASVEQDRSDASDIDPNESSADRVSWLAESPVTPARAEKAKDVVVVADAEDAEGVQGHSPELGDHASTSRQNRNPLQLIHEAMAVYRRRSDEKVDKLMQTEQQLEVLRDCHAQLRVKLQSTDKEREELQARSQVDKKLLKKFEQAAEFLQSAVELLQSAA